MTTTPPPQGPPAPTTMRLPDGRDLEVLSYGDPSGRPLLFHNGQPSAAVYSSVIDAAAWRAGLRVFTSSRPGYGGSSARPLVASDAPAYRVVDDVADARALLDAAGVGDFVTLGWSGGGPRALACAAVLPGRCRAAASVAGVAPYDAEGLAWSAGMAEENVAEYAAAREGPQAYEAWLTENFLPVLATPPEELADALGGLVAPVDRTAMRGGLAPWMAATFHRAGVQGVRGVRDDGLAVVAPWGFDVASITTPTAVWQGGLDAFVPAAHGAWLAGHVPGTRAHLLPEEGHLSLSRHFGVMFAELQELAGW